MKQKQIRVYSLVFVDIFFQHNLYIKIANKKKMQKEIGSCAVDRNND